MTPPTRKRRKATHTFQILVRNYFFKWSEIEDITINSMNAPSANTVASFSDPSLNWNHEMNQFEALISGNGLSLSLGSTNSTRPERPVQNNNLNSNPSFSYDALSSILRNSPYLKPARELLDEVVCVSNAAEVVNVNGRRSSFLQLGEIGISSQEQHCLQSKLIALLNELESRYENYFNQMDQVVSSFEAVLGAGGAASSYTTLTIQAMLRHFTNLRDAIITQIHASSEEEAVASPHIHNNKESQSNNEIVPPRRENLRNLGTVQMQSRQVWRPLRGLPEDSVAVLRAWLFQHFLHPYPNDNEKLMLALRTGLSRNQISNWFINARVRLWKPMIEEMYKEEFFDDSRDFDQH